MDTIPPGRRISTANRPGRGFMGPPRVLPRPAGGGIASFQSGLLIDDFDGLKNDTVQQEVLFGCLDDDLAGPVGGL